MTHHKLTVDSEFSSIAPRLTTVEHNFLSASLMRDGCRDAIVTWANHDDTILDGHNRYRLCTENGIAFKTKAISLPDRAACIEWIITTQLGRRNLTDGQRSYLRGKRYAMEKKEHGAPTGNKNAEKQSGNNCHFEKTATKLAEEFKVSPRTIRNDAKFAEAVDCMAENVGEDVKHEILANDSPLTKKQIVAIAELPPSKQKRAVREAREGKFVTIPTKNHVPAECSTEIVSDLSQLSGRKFGTIYADPPWAYSNNATRANVRDTYSGTMSPSEVAAMPIGALAGDDAHLHLWVTKDFVFDAKQVIESWGFTYKSMFVWVKSQMGIGNYWRVSHELLLLGVRGNAKRFSEHNHKSWLEFPRGEHSAKPEKIRHIIERVSPGPFLELFGRKPVEGWTVFGNQIERRLIPA
jgi:N6-adenosine-specific RNA methylase IME4